MLAFHNDLKIKEFHLNRVKEHQKLDEIIKGIYWGCSYQDYEKELGIPTILARLEDKIFKGLPYYLAKEFPLQFLESIKVGADLSKVWLKFAIFLLTDSTQCNSRHLQCKIVANACKKQLNNKEVDWVSIRNAANNTNVGYDAAYVAYVIASAFAFANIINPADYASLFAADASDYATYESDADATYAYEKQSEKLLELLRECE